MTEAIEVKGLQDVQKALYSYSQKLGDFVVYKALRAGANIVKRRVVKLAPIYEGKELPRVKKGTLRRGFRVSKSKIHSGKMSGDMIGIFLTLKKGGGRKDLNDPFYGRWQELGWNPRGAKTASRAAIKAAFGSRTGRKSAPSNGNVKGLFFIQRAFDETSQAAADIIVKDAEAGAEVLARKVGF